MKECFIFFSGLMVCVIFEDWKIQMCCIVKLLYNNFFGGCRLIMIGGENGGKIVVGEMVLFQGVIWYV